MQLAAIIMIAATIYFVSLWIISPRLFASLWVAMRQVVMPHKVLDLSEVKEIN